MLPPASQVKRVLLRTSCPFLLVLVISFSCVYAQTDSDKKQPAETKKTEQTKPPAEEILPVTIVLAGGSSLLVDEVSESADGYWYKRGNMTTFLERARVVRIEHPKAAGETEEPEVAGPARRWTLAEANKVKEFFFSKFSKPLPLSAFGQSDLHTRWGLDHRNGMDVSCTQTAPKVARELPIYVLSRSRFWSFAVPFLV